MASDKGHALFNIYKRNAAITKADRVRFNRAVHVLRAMAVGRVDESQNLPSCKTEPAAAMRPIQRSNYRDLYADDACVGTPVVSVFGCYERFAILPSQTRLYVLVVVHWQ